MALCIFFNTKATYCSITHYMQQHESKNNISDRPRCTFTFFNFQALIAKGIMKIKEYMVHQWTR